MLKCFRVLGWFEGISLLVLLSVAMPLKYIWHLPEAVRVVGMLHGLLFLGYLFAAIFMASSDKWSYGKLALSILLSVLPFGTFIFEKKFL